MKQLYCAAPESLILRDVPPPPPPAANEIRVRSILGGICGSDINVYKGRISYAKYPIIPGHEILGLVTDAGENAVSMLGKRIAAFPNTYCGACAACKRGQRNVCAEKIPIGLSGDGFFSGEFNLDAKYAVEVPDSLPDLRAVLIEPLSVTIHALKRGGIGKGDTVAVFGCGTEGLLTTVLANYLGAEVTSLDINEKKLETAVRLGAKHTARPDELGERQFDAVVEASGARAAAEQAYQAVRNGGRIVHIGILPEVTVPMLKIVRGELDVYGSIIYTKEDFAEAIKYLSDPDFNIDLVRSKVIPFSDAISGYKDALTGEYIKIVLDFSK